MIEITRPVKISELYPRDEFMIVNNEWGSDSTTFYLINHGVVLSRRYPQEHNYRDTHMSVDEFVKKINKLVNNKNYRVWNVAPEFWDNNKPEAQLRFRGYNIKKKDGLKELEHSFRKML